MADKPKVDTPWRYTRFGKGVGRARPDHLPPQFLSTPRPNQVVQDLDDDDWHWSSKGYNFRKPICKHGHDKRKVGVVKSGKYCRECARQKAFEKYEHKTDRTGGIPGNPSYLPGLKYWRSHKGYSHDALAEATGLTWRTIVGYERNEHRAFLATRRKIAEVLGVSVGDLMVQPPGIPKDLRKSKKKQEVA